MFIGVPEKVLIALIVLYSVEFPKFIYSNFMQFKNISSTEVTSFISKLDKSREIKDLQSLNIEFKLGICPISKLDKSNEVNDSHPSNNPNILYEEVVSKLDKLRDSKEVQPLNIFSI